MPRRRTILLCTLAAVLLTGGALAWWTMQPSELERKLRGVVGMELPEEWEAMGSAWPGGWDHDIKVLWADREWDAPEGHVTVWSTEIDGVRRISGYRITPHFLYRIQQWVGWR